MPNLIASPAVATADCRCCGAPGARVLDQGRVAPFFAQRVLGVRVASLRERLGHPRRPSLLSGIGQALAGPVTSLLGATAVGRRLLERRAPLLTRIRACPACHFVGPHADYPDEQLLALYRDYRSASYNEERSSLEPAYRRVQAVVGKGREELDGRLGNVGRLLRSHLDLEAIRSVLDWGGGEGNFVPRELRDRRVVVLDVSSEALAFPGFVRVDQPPAGVQFEFVQVCHVLEHVVAPRRFLEQVLLHVKPGGHLYVEVPQDRSDADVQGLVDGRPGLRHAIHEHLNLYTRRSLRALAGSLGFHEVAVEAAPLELGWTTMTVLSGLFTRPP